jgi:hypothetical protein
VELETLDFDRLTPVSYASAARRRAAARGVELARKIFRDDNFYYKVWPAESRVCRTVYVAGQPIIISLSGGDGREYLPGFLCGLYDDAIVPGFVDNIYSKGRLVGYITQAGEVLDANMADKEECLAFLKDVIQRSIQSRHIIRDLHPGNVIRLPSGRLSLIDLETPLAHLDSLDLNLETQSGALRRGTFLHYRQFILDFFDVRCTDAVLIGERQKTIRSMFQATSIERYSPSDIREPLEEFVTDPILKASGDAVLMWIANVERQLAEL